MLNNKNEIEVKYKINKVEFVSISKLLGVLGFREKGRSELTDSFLELDKNDLGWNFVRLRKSESKYLKTVKKWEVVNGVKCRIEDEKEIDESEYLALVTKCEISYEKTRSEYEGKIGDLEVGLCFDMVDEDVFIEIFGDKLRQEGFDVVAAKNGAWGVKEALKGEFACILLDMMMPAMNGHEVIKELRADEKTKNTPVIILSNSALDSEVKQAIELGANEYYIKTQVTPG
ncbi:MAG: response regulator [Bacteroidota bacterium]